MEVRLGSDRSISRSGVRVCECFPFRIRIFPVALHRDPSGVSHDTDKSFRRKRDLYRSMDGATPFILLMVMKLLKINITSFYAAMHRKWVVLAVISYFI